MARHTLDGSAVRGDPAFRNVIIARAAAGNRQQAPARDEHRAIGSGEIAGDCRIFGREAAGQAAEGGQDQPLRIAGKAGARNKPPAQIEALVAACEHDAVGGLLAHRLADTLKQAEGGRVAATIDRSAKWLAQTPQMFRLGMLQAALLQAGADVTDEAGAMEAMGHAPLLVPGGAQNFKVTYAEDFALAEAVLVSRQQRKNT